MDPQGNVAGVELAYVGINQKILLNITNLSGECLSLIKTNYSFNTHAGHDVIHHRLKSALLTY